MAIDVGDLVDSLKRAVNPPGEDLYPNAVAADYEGHLSDAFWELTMWGYISGYTETDGVITEDVATPTTDLGRDYQQLMVMVAGINIVRMLMVNLNTQFRAHAGPVEYEVRKAASTLSNVMESLERRLASILSGLPDANSAGNDYYFDVITLRSDYTGDPYNYWGA